MTPSSGYRWSSREASQDSSFSELKDVLLTEESSNPGLDDFDFGFDGLSNVVFTGLISDATNTALSNVYVTFKPAEASDFNPYKVIPRLNQEYFTDHLSVLYNGETDIGTTWSIFWEEATTDQPQSGGLFFLRTQILNNNSSDTDVVFSEFAKTVYEVEDRITDQFRVYQKEGTKVLGVWVQDNADLYYSVFDIVEDKLFDAQLISQSGINPVNIDVAIEEGLSLITWNTRGQEGGDIRWGSIPSGSSTFNYQYALQSMISGMTEYSITPQIILDPARQVVFSWLGNNSLDEISNRFIPQFVQSISVPYPTGSLGGRVTDAVSQQPIPNVLVQLILNNAVVASTKTNSQGDYIFVDMDSGFYNLQMIPIWWYPSFEQQVLIPPGETSLLDVSLKRLTINRN